MSEQQALQQGQITYALNLITKDKQMGVMSVIKGKLCSLYHLIIIYVDVNVHKIGSYNLYKKTEKQRIYIFIYITCTFSQWTENLWDMQGKKCPSLKTKMIKSKF